MESTLSRIIDNMDTVFRGDAWHGPSIMEIVNSLPIHKWHEGKNISKQTIAQNIFHLTAYKKFVLEKLNENIHYRLETEEENWGSPEQLADTTVLKNNLIEAHNQLIKKLETLNDDILDKNVPGEYYNYYTLLNGLIQHDTYHLGMIWVLWQ